MATAEQMTAAVHGYVEAFEKGDAELAVALFAPDATVEDPVGTPVKRGHEEIRAFYAASMQTGAKLRLEGPIRCATDHAAFAFRVQLTLEGKMVTVDVIDIFRFNDAGKIVEMKAYFGPSNMTGL
jgi:steroid delta-isomerase